MLKKDLDKIGITMEIWTFSERCAQMYTLIIESAKVGIYISCLYISLMLFNKASVDKKELLY